jgi:alpha-beta hydrolase superfamily lysophospholipase
MEPGRTLCGVDIDVLGDAYHARSLPLTGGRGSTAGGDIVATLVRHRARRPINGAVLYVHGFADYFFQRHVAEHFAARGFDFYALDLRAYGRSLRQHQLPNFVTDLRTHFEELDAAAAAIREEDGHRSLVVLGHSTGGLVTSLWAHERRTAEWIDALVLNSPWLDLAEPWHTRMIATVAVDVLGAMLPQFVVRSRGDSVYGPSLHRDHHGEWEYDQRWKPIAGFPVRAGWLRTVRRGHARVHHGLDVRVPVLVMHPARSRLRTRTWSPEAMRADTVLDVKQTARWASKIGRRVTVVQVEDGLHDVFLSAEPVRQRALAAVDSWLEEHLPSTRHARADADGAVLPQPE